MALNQFPRRSFVGSSTLQTFTGNGSTTVYTLSSAQTQNEVFLYVDDVIQVPGTDFTVSGTTLTFTSAPTNGAEIIIRGFGVPAPVTTVSDGSVTAAKLATGAIEAKLGYTPVSPTQLSDEVAALVDSAPSTLNTLNELAAALGDDANYATTITNALATKADTSSLGTLATVSPTGTPDNTKFLRGDNSWQVVAVTPTAVSDQDNTSTGYFKVPTGTTAQRPASPSIGMTRFNTSDNRFEVYDGTAWMQMKPTFVATGGTFTQSGGYTYHAFTSSGTFTVTTGSNSVEVLVVAGGGGGGWDLGGAGGAGGLIYNPAYSVVPGSYSVTIGGGGAYSTTGSVNGSNGSNSAFGSLTAIGGGGGGSYPAPTTGSNGGSGGGGGSNTGSGTVAGGSGTAGQGNAGGAGVRGLSDGNYGITGGGGGAGQAGFDGNNQNGKGGNGLQYTQFASWGSPAGWFAGGGGGSSDVGGNVGAGGSGGGGTGGQNGASAGNGVANTGGGAGGSGLGNSGTGGSGIVIVRYAT